MRTITILTAMLLIVTTTLAQSKNGEYKRYSDNGTVDLIENYVNGKLHGERISYLDNGDIYFIENYVNGELQGEYKKYGIDGSLEFICYYVNSELHGEKISYHESNGKIETVTNYVNGKAHGVSKYYRDNGTLSNITYYEHGEFKGRKYYDENGKVTSTQGIVNDDNNGSPTSCVVCSKKIYPNSGTGNYYSLYYWASPKIGGLGCTQRSTKERPTSKMKGMGPYCSSSCCNSSSAKSGRAAPYNR